MKAIASVIAAFLTFSASHLLGEESPLISQLGNDDFQVWNMAYKALAENGLKS